MQSILQRWIFTSGEAMLVYKSILLSKLLGAQAPVKSGVHSFPVTSTSFVPAKIAGKCEMPVKPKGRRGMRGECSGGMHACMPQQHGWMGGEGG